MRRWALFSYLFLCGCAQPPTQELDMAVARIDRAIEEGAAQYAQSLLRDAQNSLARAREAQTRKSRYREAVRLAARACLQADEARDKAAREKEKVARQTEQWVRECGALLEEARYRAAETLRRRELESFAARHAAAVAALAEGRVSDAFEPALQLKKELLAWLRELEKD